MEGFGNFKSFKTDERPKKYGWAPGNYTCKCSECECDFVGDKRASMCADCAYSPKIEARNAKRDKEQLKKKVIDLHLNNPTLSDEKLGKHFDISGTTAAKYVKEYHQTIKPLTEFYNNLMLLAEGIKATELNRFYNFVVMCINEQENNHFLARAVASLLQIDGKDVEKIFEHCVKYKIFIRRLECVCGQLVQGDFPQCPVCKIGKFRSVFEVTVKLSKTRRGKRSNRE